MSLPVNETSGLKRSLLVILAIVVIAGGALALRLPRLDLRPMHCDEAVHAVKTITLMQTGKYEFNPREFHGPTPYYAGLPFFFLATGGDANKLTEPMLRMVPVFFGVLLVLLAIPARGALGPLAAILAALLTAVSPSMAFYSRYYIQEILLITFAFGAILSGWRYYETRKLFWALLMGTCLGLMHATKETCVLSYAAMGFAVLAAVVLEQLRNRERINIRWVAGLNYRHAIACFLVAIGFSVVFLSGFFTNPRGALDAILTYFHYLGRASAQQHIEGGASWHDHPWNYYLKLLIYFKNGAGPWWSEAFVLVAAVLGGFVALFDRRSNAFHRFILFYTIALTVVYAIIPYKTPWCLLNFYHSMILLAALGLAWLIRVARWIPLQVVVCGLLIVPVVHLEKQAQRANFKFSSDPRNPYVYAHTSPDFLRMVGRIKDLAALDPAGQDLYVQVLTTDYWPLPWYLRGMTKVGYWGDVPEVVNAPLIVSAVEQEPALSPKLTSEYRSELYGIRPEVLINLNIRKDLWDRFMASRQQVQP